MGKKNRRDGADSAGILGIGGSADGRESTDSRENMDSRDSTDIEVPGSDKKDLEYGRQREDGKRGMRDTDIEMPGSHGKDAVCEQPPEAGKSAAPGKGTELSGLTAAQVEERIAGGLTNSVHITTGKTTAQIVTSNLFTYFNLIFLILAVLLCLVGSYRNLTFLPVIIGNTVIGIFQELRAKRTLDRMNMLNAPHAVAVRENVQSRIPSEELVQDDVVLLAAGDQICADARVLQGNISVNESLLTGEADEIRKEPGDALLSGSFVVAGQCYAKLERVGEASYISKLTAQAKALGSGEQSEMVRSINQLVKWVGILIIPVGAVLFCQAYFVNGETIRTSIVSMIAAVIGMIPEGLYLLTTAALALSTIRLAGRKVLLHDMKSIEALARVDVLCVDKTGTITEPGMQVEKILPRGCRDGIADSDTGERRNRKRKSRSGEHGSRGDRSRKCRSRKRRNRNYGSWNGCLRTTLQPYRTAMRLWRQSGNIFPDVPKAGAAVRRTGKRSRRVRCWPRCLFPPPGNTVPCCSRTGNMCWARRNSCCGRTMPWYPKSLRTI